MSFKNKPNLGEVKPGHKWRDYFDTNYLASWDIDKDTIVTISKVKYEEVTGEKGRTDKCLVAYFDGIENGMIVNVTNSKTIQKLYNEPDPAKWVGKKITLFVDPNVSIKGEKVGGLRIRPILPKNGKEKLSPERFNNMINAISAGSYKKIDALERFELTAEQRKKISAL